MAPRGDTQLAIGYWIVSHKSTLRTWWAIVLMGIMFLATVWTVVFLAVYITQQPRVDAAMRRTGQRTGEWAGALGQPAALTVASATVIQHSSSTVDVMAMVSNPNREWAAANVRYHMVVNGQPQPSATTFMNPLAERPVIALRLASSVTAPTAAVVIEDVAWRRVTDAALPPAVFTVSDVNVTPTTVSQGSVATVNVRAAIKNASVYNYFRVRVPVVVKAGETPVAIDEIVIDRWATLTTQTVQRTWPHRVPGATTAVFYPDVSRFDLDNVYR